MVFSAVDMVRDGIRCGGYDAHYIRCGGFGALEICEELESVR